jgi:hypothetical protein
MKAIPTAMALAIAAVVSGASLTSRAQVGQKAVIPAYFGIEKRAEWDKIEAAGDGVQLVVLDPHAFLRYDITAGKCPPSPTFTPTSEMTGQLDRLRRKGQLVLGYVDTSSGAKSETLVDCETDLWFNTYGGGQIDGIFFDQGPAFFLDNAKTDEDYRRYYLPLYARFKAAHPTAKSMLNVPLFPNRWIMSAADFVVLFEGPYVDPAGHGDYVNRFNAFCLDSKGRHACAPPSWWKQYPGRVSHIVFAVPGDKVNDVIRKSIDRGASGLYVYESPCRIRPDGTCNAAKYDHTSILLAPSVAAFRAARRR